MIFVCRQRLWRDGIASQTIGQPPLHRKQIESISSKRAVHRKFLSLFYQYRKLPLFQIHVTVHGLVETETFVEMVASSTC